MWDWVYLRYLHLSLLLILYHRYCSCVGRTGSIPLGANAWQKVCSSLCRPGLLCTAYNIRYTSGDVNPSLRYGINAILYALCFWERNEGSKDAGKCIKTFANRWYFFGDSSQCRMDYVGSYQSCPKSHSLTCFKGSFIFGISFLGAHFWEFCIQVDIWTTSKQEGTFDVWTSIQFLP